MAIDSASFRKLTQDVLNKNEDLREGKTTQAIEKQTAKVPSVGYLGLAIGSMIVSAGFELFSDRKEVGNFIGLWAPCFLLMGIYNKLVKLEGSDRLESNLSSDSVRSVS